jgi:MFS-type transporter involved in bile tolerance (Atg22 family)
MQHEVRTRGNYGTLERWTVALFALSFILPATIPAIVCLICAKYWTVNEKLIAFFAPILIFVALAIVFSATEPMQNWIRIPMMFTVSGISFIFSAIFLYTRGRLASSAGTLAP